MAGNAKTRGKSFRKLEVNKLLDCYHEVTSFAYIVRLQTCPELFESEPEGSSLRVE